VDFNTELQPGDRFHLVVDKSIRDGRVVGYGPLAAATLQNAGRELVAIRFTPAGGPSGYYDTDGKSKVFWWLDVGTYQQPVENSYNYFLYPGLELKPVSNVTVRFEPGYEQVSENAQYVTAYADPAATETFGTRYVFARLTQKTFVGGVRLNVAFSPTTSLQFYGQPLISIGEYKDYKALARPRSYDFEPVPIADGSDDFNFKSLRGNAIFRWEYRPGSALFLVWNHGRVNEDPTDGRFTFSKSFSSLFEQEADNIFLAKLTYYFTL